MVNAIANEESEVSISEVADTYIRLENDLHYFAEMICSEYLTCKVPNFHKELYKFLPTESRLVIAAFRGSAKSTICSVIYPLWLAVFGKKKDICIVSASETLAVEWLRKIKRELEINPEIHRWVGDLKSNKWTETHIITKTGVNIRARGAGGQIRGFRPDCVILDDIESDESVQSEDQRKKLKEWLNKACINTLLPGGQLILMGTIIHPLSLLAEIVSAGVSGWKTKTYQAYKDGVQEEGHEIWPEMWPHKRLQERKAEIGSWAFESEFMNNPMSSEGNAFSPSDFREFDELPKIYSYFVTIDPAFSEQSTANYGVILTCAVDGEQNLFVDHYFHRKTTSGTLIKAFISIFKDKQNRIQAVGVEEVGPQKGFFQNLQSECQRAGLYPNFIPLKGLIHTPSGSIRSKKDRIIATLQPRFEAGRIYIRKEMTDLISQLTTYPATKYDDLVDALAYQYEIIGPIYYTEGKENQKYQPLNERFQLRKRRR